MTVPTRETVVAVRQFNRFYTRQIGLLDAGFLESPYSLTEVRVLYEIAYGDQVTATALSRSLGLDLGYISRIVSVFAHNGLVTRRRSTRDGRETNLTLSPKGRVLFRELERRQHDQIEQMLHPVAATDQHLLLSSFHSIQRIFGAHEPSVAQPVKLRQPHPGDMGWIVHRQAILYNEEYGWNEEYEAIVAQIVARFIQNFDVTHERCWIAEQANEIIGSVFCVQKTRTIAQLRLLYVEPSARGLGVGTRLVDECISFARSLHYRKLVLWTNSVLHSARRIYERAGFKLAHEEPYHGFGKDLVAQTWELSLS